MIEDPKSVFKELKGLIRKIEKKPSKELLNDVKNKFLEMIEAIKLYLIMNKDSYYGNFFVNMTYEIDFECDSIAGIKLDSNPPVFISNPLLLCKFTIQEVLFIICHEIEHIILNHPVEMLKSNPSKDPQVFLNFNYAADASVNDRLIYEKRVQNYNFLKFPNGCIDSKTFARVFNLSNVLARETYLYYFDLIKDMKNFDIPSSSKQSMMEKIQGDDEGNSSANDSNQKQGDNEGNSEPLNENKDDSAFDEMGNDSEENSPSNDANRGNSELSSEDMDKNNSNEIENESEGNSLSDNENQNQGSSTLESTKNAKNTKEFNDHNWGENLDVDELEANVNAFVKKTFEQLSTHQRGLLPASCLDRIEKMDNPPAISWQSLLKKYVGTISAEMKSTKTRLNRRQPHRFDLSGKMSDKMIGITVAIDTSGSMSNKAIGYVLNEVEAILSKKKYKLTIIEFDAEIQKIYSANKKTNIDYDVIGRGGTYVTPVIEYLNSHKEYRDNLLIIFTDGGVELEIPKPKVYRVMWVITTRKEDLNVKEPYGLVVEMNKEDEY